MAESCVLFRVGFVHADVDCIDYTVHPWSNILAKTQICKADGVYSDFYIEVGFDGARNLKKVVKPFGRLTVTAENNLIVGTHIPFFQLGENLIYSGLLFKEQGVGTAQAVSEILDAEFAGAGASVGKIDIKAAAVIVYYTGHLSHLTFKMYILIIHPIVRKGERINLKRLRILQNIGRFGIINFIHSNLGE